VEDEESEVNDFMSIIVIAELRRRLLKCDALLSEIEKQPELPYGTQLSIVEMRAEIKAPEPNASR
jgi:hypothetical protein